MHTHVYLHESKKHWLFCCFSPFQFQHLIQRKKTPLSLFGSLELNTKNQKITGKTKKQIRALYQTFFEKLNFFGFSRFWLPCLSTSFQSSSNRFSKILKIGLSKAHTCQVRRLNQTPCLLSHLSWTSSSCARF